MQVEEHTRIGQGKYPLVTRASFVVAYTFWGLLSQFCSQSFQIYPPGHKWVFALADAGVLLDLHSSPTFLMLPGKDMLHGTLYMGKGTGEDHIEHSSGGSVLMNKAHDWS